MTFPRIAALKTAAAFRAHLSQSGIPLAFDDTLAPPGQSPLAAPIDVDGHTGRQPVLHPADGRVGRDRGRRAQRPDHPPLAPLRHQRRQADVGRRGGRGPPRRPRQPESADADAEDAAGDRARCAPAWSTPIASLRRERRCDLLVGLQLTHSGRFARPDVYDRPAPLTATTHPILDRRFPHGRARPGGRRAAAAGRRVRRRREAGAGGRVRVRGPEALPRLPGPRAARLDESRRAGTAARSRTAPASCARSSRGSAPRCRA